MIKNKTEVSILISLLFIVTLFLISGCKPSGCDIKTCHFCKDKSAMVEIKSTKGCDYEEIWTNTKEGYVCSGLSANEGNYRKEYQNNCAHDAKWAKEETPTKTCAEQGGYICTEDETCQGNTLSASDTDKCCSVSCTPRGDESKTCSEQNGNICTEDETCPGNILLVASDTDKCCSTICIKTEEIVCCEKTINNEYCVDTPDSSNCDPSFSIYNGQCSDTYFCENICCILPEVCMPYTPRASCVNSEGGVSEQSDCSGIADCKGCCNINNEICELNKKTECEELAAEKDYIFDVNIMNIYDCKSSCRVSSCIDSDGGENYDTKGVVVYPCADGPCRMEDVCHYATLEERYCKTQEEPGTITHRCPLGCKDGACISSNCESEGYKCCPPSKCINETPEYRGSCGLDYCCQECKEYTPYTFCCKKQKTGGCEPELIGLIGCTKKHDCDRFGEEYKYGRSTCHSPFPFGIGCKGKLYCWADCSWIPGEGCPEGQFECTGLGGNCPTEPAFL